MSFEVRSRDLLARLGRIETKSGTIETPILLPVVNPAIQLITPKAMRTEFGCQALISNAYILKQQKGGKSVAEEVHRLLDFDGVVMTDSGAYQILVYGEVEVTPEDIVRYQEQLSTDIATILDIPTRRNTTKEMARHSVCETMERAEQLAQIKARDDILWVGPIQGGTHLDLVAYSAQHVGNLPFQIHALGSPTTVMEQYHFDVLAQMILTAKTHMPIQRPLHLFGAGHPFMFALAIALGCDMFDSAAYAIYARHNRYMTEYGTSRLDDLEYFPCSCPICARTTPTDLKQMPRREREEALARHNLYASFGEVRRVKQTITEGRLWEYLEARCHTHPSLLKALGCLKDYANYIEQHSPVTKTSGLFFFGSSGLSRPEIVRHRKRLRRFSPPEKSKVTVLLPPPSKKPFHETKPINDLVKRLRKAFPQDWAKLHICVYAAPVGVVPLELDEVYPLSQHEAATPHDVETIDYVVAQIIRYIAAAPCDKVVLVENGVWVDRISPACKTVHRDDLSISVLRVGEKLSEDDVGLLVEALRKMGCC